MSFVETRGLGDDVAWVLQCAGVVMSQEGSHGAVAMQQPLPFDATLAHAYGRSEVNGTLIAGHSFAKNIKGTSCASRHTENPNRTFHDTD